ncbi:MAG: two component transcriptional regulator, LuxR family [Modestobacter sp.]|jgi:hypothetical protein|nr:two component transcriptional regulator, LuxR family [Modestobacter sp.]
MLQVKAVARVLGITLDTCRGYVKSLHVTLGVRSQLQAGGGPPAGGCWTTAPARTGTSA